MGYFDNAVGKTPLWVRAFHPTSLGALGRIEDAAKPKKPKRGEEVSTNQCIFPIDDKDKAIELAKGKTPDEIIAINGETKKTLQDGSFALTNYYQPSIAYTYSDIGVNEEDLIDGVSLVLGNCDLQDTALKNTAGIKKVQGDLSVSASNGNLTDISSIREVGGSVFVHASDESEIMKTLKRLKFKPDRIGGKIIQLPVTKF